MCFMQRIHVVHMWEGVYGRMVYVRRAGREGVRVYVMGEGPACMFQLCENGVEQQRVTIKWGWGRLS